MTISEAAGLAGIVSFAASWIIIPWIKQYTNPNTEGLKNMQKSVDDLTGAVKDLCKEVAQNNEELAGNKQQIKTLFMDTQRLEHRVEKLEERCDHCPAKNR